MTLRGYRPADLDAMYDICLKTGDSGDDATGIYTDPRLLGEVFVGPYAAFEPDLAFVVEDDEGVGGYVIGARDTRGFEQSCEREWWPALRERYPENAFPADGRDAKIVRLIHHPGAAAEHIVRDYPSHLHIDLLPRTQGRG